MKTHRVEEKPKLRSSNRPQFFKLVGPCQRQLRDVYKAERLTITQKFLKRYEDQGGLSKVVGDI